jgi:hypothetical protein
MPTAILVIRGGLQALYPYTQTISFDTCVKKNINGSEQRSARNNGLMKFELNWGALLEADKNTLKALFTTAKGQFEQDFTLTIGGVTYTNLSLDSDLFEASQAITLQNDVKLSFSQVLSQSLSPGTAGTAFPGLSAGCVSQLPYTARKRFSSIVNKMPSGPKFAFAQFGGGLTNFPTDGLMGYQVGGTTLSDADVATLSAHFIANYGRFSDFSFTDPNSGTTYTKTHYVSDQMVITANAPNRNSMSIGLEVTF